MKGFRILWLAIATLAMYLGVSWGQDAFPLRPSEVPARSGSEASAPSVTAQRQTAESAATAEPAPTTQTSGWVDEYVVAQGDNLSKIASQAYGRAGYWRLLKLYNDCDPEKLIVGQVVRAPDLNAWLEAEGILPLLEEPVTELMKARETFMEAEASMESSGTVADEATKARILEAKTRLERAQALFMEAWEGVTGSPNSMVQQLRTAASLMGEVADGGAAGRERKQAEVHERIGNALTYCIIWARDGFD